MTTHRCSVLFCWLSGIVLCILWSMGNGIWVMWPTPLHTIYTVTFVEFASATYTVSEEQSFVVLVVNKTGVTQEDVPVMIELADGTARGTSLANRTETLNFAFPLLTSTLARLTETSNSCIAFFLKYCSRYYSIVIFCDFSRRFSWLWPIQLSISERNGEVV